MKKIGVVLLFVCIIILGCSDVPPEPGTPGAGALSLGRATGIFDGYGPAFSVFEEDGSGIPPPLFTIGSEQDIDEEVFFIGPNEQQLILPLDVQQLGGYVYGRGYYYNVGNGVWEPFSLDGERVGGSNFIANQAGVTLNIDRDALGTGDVTNFVLTYSCKKYTGHGTDFKCGCSSTTGPCNQWMLQYFYLDEGTNRDQFEPDNTLAQAVVIPTDGTLQSHSFTPARDIDFVKFDATAGERFIIRTTNLGDMADTVMSLFDTDGVTEIAFDDDGGDGLASMIIFRAENT